jgi:hypothetical protein
MKTFTTESKTTPLCTTQQIRGDGHHVQTVPLMLAHDEIARRAYEIYIKKGSRQGQCERNWLQAEIDLRKERKA